MRYYNAWIERAAEEWGCSPLEQSGDEWSSSTSNGADEQPLDEASREEAGSVQFLYIQMELGEFTESTH